ncbi:MAG: hypothetical protein Q7T57_02745 [Dehalococcoidales bacterium]|nr:hypothetical protein [Dehalococcoidales bacterium]
MWEAEHTEDCKDPTRFEVVREVLVVEDSEGNTLNSDLSQSDVRSAECANCGAIAQWTP